MEQEKITGALKQWHVSVEVPGRFQAGVWQRIADRERMLEASPMRRFARSCFQILATPAYALALLIVTTSLSLSVAHLKAAQSNAKMWDDLRIRYVKTIDPYLHHSAT